MSKWLSKSDYLKFLVAPAWLWLKKHDPDKLPPFSEAAEFLARQGDEIESYARQLFPEGVLVEGKITEMADKTAAIIKQVTPDQKVAIFQAAVLTDRNLYAAADILTKNWDDSWDIYEVKSTASVKSEHIDDLAFQKIAFTEAGYSINHTHLIHIDTSYVRQGDIDPRQFLTSEDVTEMVDGHIPSTRRKIPQALKVIDLPICPSHGLVNCSNLRRWLDVFRHLEPELPNDSIYNLCRLSLGIVKKLNTLGVERISDIPETFNLSPHQLAQVTAVKKSQALIDHKKIATRLAKLTFPVYFLDYETVFAGVPLWDGVRPYSQVPFQYSLSVLESPGAEVVHHEYLARGTGYPVAGLLEQLQKDIGREGSIVVWNQQFEAGVNQTMGQAFPEAASFLRNLNKRLFDLMEMFSNLWYVDHRFMGSASIKNVLPVLVPELRHKDLDISAGDMASQRWYKVAHGDITGTDADKVYRDLLEYCRLDTVAMVRIYQFLAELTRDTTEVPATLPF